MEGGIIGQRYEITDTPETTTMNAATRQITEQRADRVRAEAHLADSSAEAIDRIDATDDTELEAWRSRTFRIINNLRMREEWNRN